VCGMRRGTLDQVVMLRIPRSHFLQGLAAGSLGALLVGLLVLYALRASPNVSAMPGMADALVWLRANLGLSLPVFALLAVLYARSLRQLRRALAKDAAIEAVAQCDQLVDIWTGLFFGVGVIWTAIGMRGALVYALADPESLLGTGAHAVLERMVDGGILLALSTTILGGVGGYVFRVIKALTLEPGLRRYYERQAHALGRDTLTTLRAIEWHLHQLTRQSTPGEERTHGGTGVAFPRAQRR